MDGHFLLIQQIRSKQAIAAGGAQSSLFLAQKYSDTQIPAPSSVNTQLPKCLKFLLGCDAGVFSFDNIVDVND